MSKQDPVTNAEPALPKTDTSFAHIPEVLLRAQVQPPAPSHEAMRATPKTRANADPDMPSLGLIDRLMEDDSINDILINGTSAIYVDRRGKLVDSGLRFSTQEEVWLVAEKIMEAVNQHWTSDCPMIDTRLPDGSRVNLVGPPIAIDGVTISIRKFPKISHTLDSMAASGQISNELGIFLHECVRLRSNIIISGSTSAGKTTLLNALSSGISPDERIVTIEDSAELRLQQPHVVRMEARATRPESGITTGVSMRDLVRNALRMRPDRVILGESRGPEAFDVLQAMNTGHDGSMTTLHANNPRDALSRLETMVSLAMPQLAIKIVRQQIASAVNLVVHMNRSKENGRHISHISEICGMEGDVIVMQDLVVYADIFKRGVPEYRWNGGMPRNAALAEAARTSGMVRILR